MESGKLKLRFLRFGRNDKEELGFMIYELRMKKETTESTESENMGKE